MWWVLNFEIVKDYTLINDSTIGGENVKEIGEDEEGNKIYEVTTEEEDVFQVTIDEEGNVETEYKGPSEELAPIILAVKVTEQKTNSITVEVEVERLNGGKLSYYYKTEDEEKYTELKVNTEDLTATFEEEEATIVLIGENNEEREIAVYIPSLSAGETKQINSIVTADVVNVKDFRVEEN